ncbi:hypothetical protein TRVL_00450 [Trypanosoma vivax]|nr:hypothetical protein TRVL_00450 [Trypanosoma vivax]
MTRFVLVYVRFYALVPTRDAFPPIVHYWAVLQSKVKGHWGEVAGAGRECRMWGSLHVGGSSPTTISSPLHHMPGGQCDLSHFSCASTWSVVPYESSASFPKASVPREGDDGQQLNQLTRFPFVSSNLREEKHSRHEVDFQSLVGEMEEDTRFKQACLFTPKEHWWPSEEIESSQCSITSCVTHSAKTSAMLNVSDPGAPVKLHEGRSSALYVDDVTVAIADPARCLRSGLAASGSIVGSRDSHSALIVPGECSSLSHTTSLEDGCSSAELANNMTDLYLAVSPTQKRLIFPCSLEDAGSVQRCESNNDFNAYSASSYSAKDGSRQHCRGKRFLEMDVNTDIASQSPKRGKFGGEFRHKCRRVDLGRGADGNSTRSQNFSNRLGV